MALLSDAQFLGGTPALSGDNARAPQAPGTTPDWFRADGTQKGMGFLGPLPQTAGADKGKTSTEISVGLTINGKEMDVPSMVPTLSKAEIAYLTGGGDPRKNPSILRKAQAHAEMRLKAGKSVFAGPADYPKGTLMSDAEFLGGPAPAAPDSMQGKAAFGNQNLLQQFRGQGPLVRGQSDIKRAGAEVLGLGGQAMDLTLGIPKQMAGVFAFPIANIGAMLGGEKPADAAQFAADVKQGLLPDWLSQPFSVIAKSLGPDAERAYNENPLGWMTQHLGSATEKSSKQVSEAIGLPPETVQNFYDNVMGMLGYAGVKAGVKGVTAEHRAKFEKAFTERQAATTKQRFKGPLADSRPLLPTNEEAGLVLPPKVKPRIKLKLMSDQDFAAAQPPAAPPAVFRSGRELAAAAPSMPAEQVQGIKQYLQKHFGDKDWEEYTKPQVMAATALAGGAGLLVGSQLDKDTALAGATAMFLPAMKGDARVNAAEAMARSGADRTQIWQRTGMIKIPGTGWAEEVSDAGARLAIRPEQVNGQAVARLAAGHEVPLGAVLEHPELYDRYPELQNIAVRPTREPGMAGAYHPRTQTIYVAEGSPAEVTKSLLHEVQHNLVPGGGSPEQFLKRGIDKGTAEKLYKHLSGEVIARATEARRLMTDEERRQVPPWQSYDVPEARWLMQFEPQAPSAAVKEKGGMWHPEAVARLAAPLEEQLHHGWIPEDLKAGENVAGDWAKRAVRNYLNKHAGTATDPLRDVRIPMLGEDVRWEDVTDQIFRSAARSDKAREVGTPKLPANIPEGERVWFQRANSTGVANYNQAIQSYLSHVGDYLREFVPPERLQQYDLVRAVRETAEQDARQARKMEKARATGEGTTPYKTYPDGMRWVEVRSDEALKNEGDVMGHCVGGYCEMVHEGQSKIYSLRDAKGLSHVTIEVSPPRAMEPLSPINWYSDMLGGRGGFRESNAFDESYRRMSMDRREALKKEIENSADYKAYVQRLQNVDKPDDIVQIKGKQNRAPVAAYLPYVQDFVKSGKWGEVGDLENSGLKKFGNEYITAAEVNERTNRFYNFLREKGIETNYPIPEKFADRPEYFPLVVDELQAWEKGRPFVPRTTMFKEHGAADPRQLAAIAAGAVGAAAGAALNPDHPWLGGALGAVAGAGALKAAPLVGKGLMDATRAALQPGSLYERGTRAAGELVPGPISRAFARDSRIRIKAQMDAAEVFTRREELKANRAVNEVLRLVPREADRAAVAHAIESGDLSALTPPARQAAAIVQGFFKELGEKGLAAGTIKDLVEQYVTHVFGREALPLIDEMLRERNLGTASSVFGKTRTGPPTIAQVNAWMASKGKPPITADVAKIMTAYSNSMLKAIANRTLIDTLKQTSVPALKNGKTIQRAVVTTKPLGNYVPLGKYNLYVHPDILPALRFVFEQDSMPGVMRGVEAVNTALKRTAVSFSLFHAKSLVDAMAGGARLAKGPMLVGALAGGMYAVASDNDPITYAMIGAGLGMAAKGLKLTARAAAPKLFGENRFVKALRTGDPAMAKLIDLSFEGGLQYSLKGGGLAVEEASKGFYEGLEAARQGLDKLVPGAGKAVRGVELANHAMDTFMWDRLHTAMKLEVFAEKYETLLMNNAKAHSTNPAKVPLMSEVQLAEAAASYTNDIFGGLNWRRIAEEGFTRWGRDLKMGVYRPSGRRVLRLGMFAPDWTISTTRAALKSLGPLVGQPEGGGLRGLLEPRTVTDLHRQYMIRSAFYYAMIGDGLNVAFTGHHLWQNKDPTYIELADGRKMQFSKHTMEPYHWMQHPVQQGLNKLGQVPKEALNQAFGTEYLNPRESKQGQIYAGPKMKEGRGKHLLQQLSPIGVQQFAEGPVGGVTGAVGMPIYGKTREALAAEKAARKATTDRLEAARRRREKALAR